MTLAPRRRTRLLLAGVTLAAYGLLFAPILTVVFLSFVDDAGFGFTWYRQLAADETMRAALERSLEVAAATSLIASLIGTSGALALERGRFPGRGLLDALTLLPLVMPELVLGISSLIWFSVLRMTLGTLSIVLAHTTFAISYVVVTVRASLRDFDPALLDAARDLGATPFAAFRRVLLPLIMPGIIAGAMMSFTLSFDDFLISFFTAGVGADTVPIRLYAMIRFGMSREMYALSALLVALTVSAVLMQALISANRPRPL